MYFSLITPKQGMERDAAFQWAKGPYADHQWLWQFFKAEPGSPREFLFRRRDAENQMPGFYVVSSREPVAVSDAWDVQRRSYEPQLQAGQRLTFELRANPVVSISENGKSRRNDVVMHEKKRLLKEHGFKCWSDWPETDESKPALYDLVQSTCAAWLEKRAERHGFSLLASSFANEGQALPRVRVDAYQQHRAHRKEIKFSTVDFTGELEVADADVFRKTLWEGIGHSKAFGCGLLLVKPVSQG